VSAINPLNLLRILSEVCGGLRLGLPVSLALELAENFVSESWERLVSVVCSGLGAAAGV
jgi:hypothetical protein